MMPQSRLQVIARMIPMITMIPPREMPAMRLLSLT
jgi:hypothetical protein